MTQYLTPGVYFENKDTSRATIPKTRTDIPGFVGIAEKGPLNQPVRIESWKQFQTVFGDHIPQSYLAYAVYGFFENEGRVCYVVRIAHPTAAQKASVTLLDKGAIHTVRVAAVSQGKWGEKIKVETQNASMGATLTAAPSKQPSDGSYSIVQSSIGFEKGSLVKVFQNRSGTPVEKYHSIESVGKASRMITWAVPLDTTFTGFDVTQTIHCSTVEFTLAFSLNNSAREVFQDLSLNPDHSRYLENVINNKAFLVNVEDLGSVSAVPDNIPDPEKMEKGYLYLENGANGISSLGIDHFIGNASAEEKTGLQCFEDVDEVGMIVIPDIMIQPEETRYYRSVTTEHCETKETINAFSVSLEWPPKFSSSDIQRAQSAMIDHCEKLKDRVAILDPPSDTDTSGIRDWREQFSSSFATLYFPWIRVDDPLQLGKDITRDIPPSGHVAGVFARTDLTKGVHKAPANEEVMGAKDIVLFIDGTRQELLNPGGINCIRPFPGRGVLIWGTRTLSHDPLWRYINIRRLLIMIEESVEESMQWTVFEPNDARLRNSIRVVVTLFLEALWRKGALTGKTAGEGFYVKCDGENNPQSVIDDGQIITEVGVAPSIPGEFIIFRIGKVKDAFEIMEEEV
jgi:hypothetical protein